MFSESVILKVDSEWVEHYYDKLIPWKHYIPIKSDLSDLIQRIKWCRLNDNICNKIAQNAYQFAKENFTKEKMIDYVFNSITGNPYDNFDTKIPYDYKFDISLPSLPKKENDLLFDDIKYVRTLLPNVSTTVAVIKPNSTINYWLYHEFIDFRNIITSYKSLHDEEYSKLVDKLISKAYDSKLERCNFDGEKQTLLYASRR